MKEIRTAAYRGLQSFSYAVTINLVIGIAIMALVKKTDFVPVLPEFSSHFYSPYIAFGVQCLLVGVTSMAFGAGSVIMEIARWSLVKQSIVYFITTAVVWIPVSMFCWGLGTYTCTFYTILASYLVGYIISWGVQYRICRRNIAAINESLEKLNNSFEK